MTSNFTAKERSIGRLLNNPDNKDSLRIKINKSKDGPDEV